MGKQNIMFTDKILRRMEPFFRHLDDKGKSILGQPFDKVYKTYKNAVVLIKQKQYDLQMEAQNEQVTKAII